MQEEEEEEEEEPACAFQALGGSLDSMYQNDVYHGVLTV